MPLRRVPGRAWVVLGVALLAIFLSFDLFRADSSIRGAFRSVSERSGLHSMIDDVIRRGVPLPRWPRPR